MTEAEEKIRKLNDLLNKNQEQHIQKKLWYECAKCDLKFETKSLLRNHINRKHIRQKECEFCDDKFVTNNELELT